jgi:hypothetical protein
MKKNYHLEHSEFKKLVDPGHSSVAACIATAGTAFVIGFVPSCFSFIYFVLVSVFSQV